MFLKIYKLLTTDGFFQTWSTIAVANPLSSAELGVQTTGTLGSFPIDSSGVPMCSESVVYLFGGVVSEGDGDLIVLPMLSKYHFYMQ